MTKDKQTTTTINEENKKAVKLKTRFVCHCQRVYPDLFLSPVSFALFTCVACISLWHQSYRWIKLLLCALRSIFLFVCRDKKFKRFYVLIYSHQRSSKPNGCNAQHTIYYYYWLICNATAEIFCFFLFSQVLYFAYALEFIHKSKNIFICINNKLHIMPIKLNNYRLWRMWERVVLNIRIFHPNSLLIFQLYMLNYHCYRHGFNVFESDNTAMAWKKLTAFEAWTAFRHSMECNQLLILLYVEIQYHNLFACDWDFRIIMWRWSL